MTVKNYTGVSTRTLHNGAQRFASSVEFILLNKMGISQIKCNTQQLFLNKYFCYKGLTKPNIIKFELPL